MSGKNISFDDKSLIKVFSKKPKKLSKIDDIDANKIVF